ncbi:unnamed protein product [Coffea canephora]|uniref:DH200=94 genomic scaffold, scaffold_9593 n=1 Tax=Coffea canephora TaxID=49390 RepID=A0A068VMQ7_COFCA|nr:unnamed protein product [Coffea canephora]
MTGSIRKAFGPQCNYLKVGGLNRKIFRLSCKASEINFCNFSYNILSVAVVTADGASGYRSPAIFPVTKNY